MARRKKLTKESAAPPAKPVSARQVNPVVLAKAKKLAGGDTSRLRIVSPTEVVVVNHKAGVGTIWAPE